jgi:hypothetical protein
MSKCQTRYCRNQTKGNRTHCSTCRGRRFRRNSPFKYFYGKLKQRALERGKEFSLTLDEFREIWEAEPEKWKEKQKKDSVCTWEMDRKKEEEGYHKGNIQLVKKRFNVQKYHKYYQGKDQLALEYEPDWIEEKDRETEAPF